MAADLSLITEDAVLGGRLRLRQPKRGHRVGHDAILLAAATGVRAGEQVVDLGAGIGSAGLALASGSYRQLLVSDCATVPPANRWRLGGGIFRHYGGTCRTADSVTLVRLSFLMRLFSSIMTGPMPA